MQKKNEDQNKVQQQKLNYNLSRIKNTFVVISGKGGVGKTTVAVNLAYGLAVKGFKVGILDVDIHGPNVAKMLGIDKEKLKASESEIVPVQVLPNLKAISIALIMENVDQPLIWRGPLKMRLIGQFLSDVQWGDLDYLVVDSPPGTGDEPLSVCQLIPKVNGAVVVTTPQEVAILDARKSVNFAKEIKVPVLGIIENMSGFICPHCKKEIDLFGKGGGEKAASDLKVPFLGSIPLETDFVKAGDSGSPIIHSHKGSLSGRKIAEITENIIFSMQKK